MIELMGKMYSEMKQGFANVDQKLDCVEKRLDSVEKRLDCLEGDVKSLKKDIVCIENNLIPKVEAALDGYKQHTDILQRIEKEVSRQNHYETY